MQKAGLGLTVHQTMYEANDHGRRMNVVKGKRASFCEQHFILLNRLMNPVDKVLFKCVIHFFISSRWYAFPNLCMQISRPLAYGVRISSKACTTAAHGVTVSYNLLNRKIMLIRRRKENGRKEWKQACEKESERFVPARLSLQRQERKKKSSTWRTRQ